MGEAELTPSPSGVNNTKVNPKTGAGGVEVRSGGVARIGQLRKGCED